MDNSSFSVCSHSVALHDNGDDMAVIIIGRLYTGHRPSDRVCDDDFAIYLSRLFSCGCRADTTANLDEAESVDIRHRVWPECTHFRAGLRLALMDGLHGGWIRRRLGGVLLVPKNPPRIC